MIYSGEYDEYTEMPLDGTIATTKSTSVLFRGNVFDPTIPFPVPVDDAEVSYLYVGNMGVSVVFLRPGEETAKRKEP
jgi:hypothetical protein